MSAPRVIAICGLAGAGKSTIADHLVERHRYTRVKFAGPLKDMLRSLGLDDDELEGDLKERPCGLLCGMTPRHAMVTLGTEWGRNLIGPDLWVSVWHERVASILSSGGRVVVDDLRFPNEHARAVQIGASVLRVSRPRESSARAPHESEAYANTMQVDHEVVNGGGVSDLLAAVDMWLLGPYGEPA